jgi:predicted metal-dependent phosphotriesterase family hydrolase
MSQSDERPSPIARRRVLKLLGAGAGLGAAWEAGLVPDALDGMQSSGGAAAAPPRGRAIIRTVLADLDPATLTGATLMHEHLGNGRVDGQATNPTQDAGWMAEELSAAKKVGLNCIVAAQTGLPGGEILSYLRQLTEKTGVQIVNAAAHYTAQTYPRDVTTKTEEQIADDYIEAARVGRLGAFGELGMLNDAADLDPLEKKMFRAVGKAQARTGIPVFTHTNYSTGAQVSMDIALRQLDALESAGGRPASIAIGHVCCLDDPMVDVAKRVARRGAFVAFDRVTRQQQWVPDAKKVAMVKALLDAGLGDRLLLSSDYIGRINTSVGEINAYPGPLHAREGGPGYARPLVLFVPLLRKAGVSEAGIRQLTVENPRRFLSFVPASV